MSLFIALLVLNVVTLVFPAMEMMGPHQLMCTVDGFDGVEIADLNGYMPSTSLKEGTPQFYMVDGADSTIDMTVHGETNTNGVFLAVQLGHLARLGCTEPSGLRPAVLPPVGNQEVRGRAM
jgi:hypothetical protein